MAAGERGEGGLSRVTLTGLLDDLFGVLGHFPIPAEVFAADGSSLFVNQAFSEVFGIGPDQLVGSYNVLEDRYLQDEPGLADHLARGFAGEANLLHDVRVPLGEFDARYHRRDGLPGGVDVYQDIACLPLTDRQGGVVYVVALFLTKNVYGVHQAVVRARAYLDEHWWEPFDLDVVAPAVGLSRSHLSRLFRRYLGTTPYRYYQEVKLEKVKAALADPGLSISEAFARCGVDYCGGFAAVFKRAVGRTPSAYRREFAGVPSQPGPGCRPPSLDRDEQRLFRVADLLPIPIQIFRPNGDAAFINQAVLRAWNVRDAPRILGEYNLLTDPLVNDLHGLRPQVARAFAGETVLVADARLPLDTFWATYRKMSSAFDAEAIYTDILNFPIRDATGVLCHVMSVFFTSRVYRGRREVVRAREHLENHWREDFDAEALARLVKLSSSQLSRLFRQDTGLTPYGYYQQIRLDRFKAALKDPELSIAQAFSACGMEHQGNATRFFKERTGLTPSQYRLLLAQD